MRELAPVILFGFNRPEHFEATVQALKVNPEAPRTEVFVFVDGPRGPEDEATVAQVRRLTEEMTGFGRVHPTFAPANKGLAPSILDGVGAVLERRGRAVVLEDDILVSPAFLGFMNEGLARYGEHPDVGSINSYTPGNVSRALLENEEGDVFFVSRSSSWGWGTWWDRWKKVDWRVEDYEVFARSPAARRSFNRCGDDLAPMLKLQKRGLIDSWAVRWAYAHFRHGWLSAYPTKSLVSNIGMDATGTHCRRTARFEGVVPGTGDAVAWPSLVEESATAVEAFSRFYRWRLLSRLKWALELAIPRLPI